MTTYRYGIKAPIILKIVSFSSQVSDLNSANSSWQTVGARLCGREVPAAVTTRSETTRVTFRSNGNDVVGDGFSIYWTVECGETFNGTDRKSVV